VASSDSDSGAPDAGARPVIGVTTYLEQAQTGIWDVRASFLPELYISAVTEAGGIALLLPPQPVDDAVARATLARLDGLIVSGGADVDPRRYGQEPHPLTGAPRVDRDDWEDALLRTAIETGLPFLGICRGVQMLNVALGGTLVQHLPDVVGHDGYQPGAAVFGRAPVDIDPGSVLGRTLGELSGPLEVELYHHQSLDAVADGLIVTARSAEGVIEAVELADAPFGVGVQWHPEQDAADRRLFAGLVDAARRHRDVQIRPGDDHRARARGRKASEPDQTRTET
jgi:putative glutamine amidotransferase